MHLKNKLADSQLKKGEWNRSEFLGYELHGKTLGIVGFGKAGRLVRKNEKFRYVIVFYDPYVGLAWSRKSLELDNLLVLLT